MFQVANPYQQFFDLDGKPLDAGYIYIGQVNQVPDISPAQVYWDENGTTPAAQPLRTSRGMIARSGTPARVFINADDYSIAVRDSKGALLFYEASALSAHNLRTDLMTPGAGTGADMVAYAQPGTGSVTRTVQKKIEEVVSIADKGASTAASAATNDAAITNALAISNDVLVPDGTFVATSSSATKLKDLRGPGFIQIGTDVLPAGDFEANATISFPGTFSSFSDIFAYLSTRSIRPSATVTISVAAGTHTITGNGIEPYHPDGARINIIGAGSGVSTLKFTGLGAASSKAGIRLIGSYYLGLVNAVTLDGDNWNGHSSGGPTLGGGDPNDPMAVQAKNGASITLGADVKIYRFARNGCFAYQGSTIKADYCIATECGSDAFVASMCSNVRAIGAQAIDGWGVGFYADYGGSLWAYQASATGTKYRGGTIGGDGFAANYGGTVYADYSTATGNADTGYTTIGGTLMVGNATAGGSVLLANGGYGLRCQSGGRAIAGTFAATYNGGGGVLVTGGSQYVGDSTTTSNNTGHGCYVLEGSSFVSQGYVSKNNTGRGIIIERGGHASIIGCDIQANMSDGINCQNSTVRATSAVAVKNNAGYGVIARAAGIVDMQGVSVSATITGNVSGQVTPTNDTSSGVAQSYIYAAA